MKRDSELDTYADMHPMITCDNYIDGMDFNCTIHIKPPTNTKIIPEKVF